MVHTGTVIVYNIARTAIHHKTKYNIPIAIWIRKGTIIIGFNFGGSTYIIPDPYLVYSPIKISNTFNPTYIYIRSIDTGGGGNRNMIPGIY